MDLGLSSGVAGVVVGQQQSQPSAPSSNLSRVARVYRSTLQYVACDVSVFNSRAVFIIVSQDYKKVFLWVGSRCQPVDRTLAETIAFDVIKDDFGRVGELLTLQEDRTSPLVLGMLLEAMWCKDSDYKAAAAKSFNAEIAPNLPRTLSLIVPVNPPHEELVGIDRNLEKEREYQIHTLEVANVNADGSVPRLQFPPRVSPKMIVLLVVGEGPSALWMVWFGEGLGKRERSGIKAFITRTAVSKISSNRRGLESVLFARSLVVAGQDDDITLFRAHFTLSTLGLITNTGTVIKRKYRSSNENVEKQKQLGKTKTNSEMCGTDCVGEIIFKLLGMTGGVGGGSSGGGGSGLGNASGASSSSFSQRQSTSLSSSLRELATNSNISDEQVIEIKLNKALSRTTLRYINPPREGKKLLVLDLDHTLMDYSYRMEYHPMQLRRPFLDHFLTQAYKHFDIVIWSQTQWQWLELKLNELGLLVHEDYKICMALDKTSMFTVKHSYVKALKIIWTLCHGSGWGAHNTLHVDDLVKNFELNKENGLLIKPFYLREPPIGGTAGDVGGEGTVFIPEDSEVVLRPFPHPVQSAVPSFASSSSSTSSPASMTSPSPIHQSQKLEEGRYPPSPSTTYSSAPPSPLPPSPFKPDTSDSIAYSLSLSFPSSSPSPYSSTSHTQDYSSTYGSSPASTSSPLFPLDHIPPYPHSSLVNMPPYEGKPKDISAEALHDIELELLTRYICHLVTNSEFDNFSAFDHSTWRDTALQLPSSISHSSS